MDVGANRWRDGQTESGGRNGIAAINRSLGSATSTTASAWRPAGCLMSWVCLSGLGGPLFDGHVEGQSALDLQFQDETVAHPLDGELPA